MKIGAIAGRARACANCTDAMLFNYWERQPETVLIPCHRCRATHGSGFIDASKHDSFLRFLFNVYPSSFPRKVSKSVTEFLAGQVLVLIFLRNNRSTCRKFAYDQICYHFRRKIRTKHTFKSLIYSIKSRN